MLLFYSNRLQHKDVFELIKKHDLYAVIHGVIVQLIELDSDKAIAMLLEKNSISPDVVVQQLEQRQEFLYLVSYFFVSMNISNPVLIVFFF